MANILDGGAKFVKRRGGANLEGREEGPVASAYGTGIFFGDFVKPVSDGTFAACAAGDAIYGICVGVTRYKTAAGVVQGGNYLPASTTFTGDAALSNPQASIIQIIPLFSGDVVEMCVDTAAASISAAETLRFNNFDIVATAGNTTTGRSGYVVNGASGFGTSTAQLRLIEISRDPLNDVTAANWRAQFVVNETAQPTLGVATGT